MPSWEFPAHNPVNLQVRIPSGDVTVSAAATQTATVTLDGDDWVLAVTRVKFDDGTLSIIVPDQTYLSGGLGEVLGDVLGDIFNRRGGGTAQNRARRGADVDVDIRLTRHGSVDAVVELPEGSSCRVSTASGDVRCTGEYGALDIHSAGGDIGAERVSGPVRLESASGDVSVSQAREANVKTASGNVEIGCVSGDVQVHTASGNVRIEGASGHRTDVKSASGDISVGVAPGIGVYLDLSSLSGTVSSDLEPGEETGRAEMRLCCRSISGDVRVSRAAAAAAR
jgi:hypothetical protein